MKEFFKELFDYGHYFNQKIADVFTESPDKISEISIKLYSHILNAHQIWNNRLNPRQLPYGVWDIHPVHEFKKIDRTSYEHTIQILGKVELNDTINYANSKGQVFKNSNRDILFHVVNHSTYHRAQIATDFRHNGIDPLMTDYILYKR